ncbi:MAG: hypothetical protein DCC64_08010 [Planctomycetota bacterium]|nr:MAG: hypothetical protein DCC64_08010 [Planctomycetota bacterium]
MAVSAIADNEERASLIGYANYAIFRPYFQEGVDIAQPWFAFTFRRKYFDHDDMGYDSNKVRFSCPSWAHGLSDIQVNKKLLDSLQAVAMPESDPKKLGVLNAIHCFLLSYVDDDWTLDHEEAAMALRAIEVLLKATTPENPRQRKKGDFAKKEILADRLDWLLDLPAERNRFGAVVKRRLLPHLQKRRDQPVLWNWFVDLYELRNAVFHEGDAKPTVWAPREHSVIAAQVFLVALWKVLTKEFGATEPDKLMRRLQIAEKVLCESDWWRVDESGPHSNAWTRAASEVAHDALVEVMRKMYDEDNAPNT